MNEANFDEDDDVVIIEGGDLHQALVDIGLTDFECTPVNRTDFIDIEEKEKDFKPLESKFSCKWLRNLCKSIQDTSWFYRKNEQKFPEIEQLQIILKLEPLLNDHVQEIQTLYSQDSSINNYNKLKLQWSSSLIFSSIAATSFMSKPLRIPGLVTFSCSMVILACHKYLELCSTKNLKDLVSIQNNIYFLYKKVLRVLKNGYCIKASSNTSQKRFSDLETERLKYLQPICETFIQSMEKISHLYYRTSLFLINLSSNLKIDHLITKFENDNFKVKGEITYENLKKFYYIHILVQSDMMMLLATVYRHNSISDNYFMHKKLSEIINCLLKLLKKYYIKLNVIFEDYKNCSMGRVPHELQKNSHVKWQDFYIHLDLLARKIQSTYSNVCSVIDDIDNCTDSEETDEFFDKLMEKMDVIYKEIDTARNFAEFNTLLIGKYRHPRQLNSSVMQYMSAMNHTESELPVVYDKDPFIVDEVFEEYIKEEYIKPLYEDNDLDTLERMKLDKLLAKNFMSELKEVLIDKYRSMSEREAKALLRLRKNIVEKDHKDGEDFKQKIIPNPPPLSEITDKLEFSKKSRDSYVPVPLPRSKKFQLNSNVNLPSNFGKENICAPNDDSISEQKEMKERFPINMNIYGIQVPAFTVMEETFTGSGENSDEELINDDGQGEINND